jgi:hypothetical protein
MLLLVNASDVGLEFALPNHGRGDWHALVDTARAPQSADSGRYPLSATSLALLRLAAR